MLGHAAFPGQHAFAASGETGLAQPATAQPRLRLAQNTGAAGKAGSATREQSLPAGAEAAARGEISVLSAAAKAEKGKEGPIPVVDEETLSLYPTAAQCGQCHKQIYEEWSSSNHAYASISPMFHAFEQKFQHLTQGTVGTFCVRCHQQVGTQLGESRETPLWKMSQISREGVSCITCHRVQEQYGKVNGERRVEPGKIYDPVFGSGEKSVIKDILANKDTYSVKTSKDGRGTDMHNGMMTNPQITKSEFCVSCHQVAVNLGIKLEVVWDQYRASPAHDKGIACQACHMGKVPGKAEGYATGPVAEAMTGGRQLNPNRKRSNHSFYGPGYPIAHPGIFPHNKDTPEEWSVEKWLKFDYRAKWGSDQFEQEISSGKRKVNFPPEWADAGDRAQAWGIVQSNLEKIEEKKQQRKQVMENGSRIDGPFFSSDLRVATSLRFSFRVTNTDPGHNLPSGSLGAQPEIWMNVALVDPDGKIVFESGYVDSIGDMADLHSADVRQGRVPHDDLLFNLQTKFLTTNVKGTDREMYLPMDLDIDQLPFIRPANVPTTVLNHPPFVRMEQRSIPPLGSKTADYTAPASAFTKPGTYKLSVRLRSRAEPIYFMKFVKATTEMERAMNEWMIDIHPMSATFEVR